MGKSDEYQFDYLDNNIRFADQVNGALFHGKQVVKPDELEPAEARMVYLGKESGLRENFKAIVDKARMWRGSLIHVLAVENQTYVDYRMILRNMLSESIGYHKQWKQKKVIHDRKKDLATGTDAFLSGMAKEEKFVPIITLVVYCGTEHPWDGAKCLHDLLEMNEEMKAYVTNYKLNLYDCHEHDTFDEYHTGLRQLFEVVRYGRDKEQMKRLLMENREAYSSLDSDTRELLEVVAKVRIPQASRIIVGGEAGMGNEEKKYDVCKAWADWRQEGVEEGKIEGKIEGKREQLIYLVCKKLLKNKPVDVIADELEEEITIIERIIAAQKKVGNYDVEQICEVCGVLTDS